MSENNENTENTTTPQETPVETAPTSKIEAKSEAPTTTKKEEGGFEQLASRQTYKDLRLGVNSNAESNKRVRKLGDLFTGRRKRSIARVKLVKGTGKITINKVDMEKFFPRKMWQQKVLQPLVLLNKNNEYDVSVNVKGGGNTGQAEAVRLGIARCLDVVEPNSHKSLRQAGFLTRDPRKVERKKYGLRKARRGVQFSKR